MEEVSSRFFETVLKPGIPSSNARYRNALFHLLTAETSCYRYWKRGSGQAMAVSCASATEILAHNF